MKAEELRGIQAPLKERYREAPDTGRITLHAKGRRGESLSCKVKTGKALVAAGLHPGKRRQRVKCLLGDMLLQALVACAGVTLMQLMLSPPLFASSCATP